jgi:septum site-determining protein MinD
MLAVEDISELLGIELLGIIPEDEQIIIAQNHGMPVVGQHTVSEKYFMQLAGRLMGEEIPQATGRRKQKIFTGFFLRRKPEELYAAGGQK